MTLFQAFLADGILAILGKTQGSREFLLSFLKAEARSPKQIERRKRIQAKGRKHFIFYAGILGWGMPVLVATTWWDWYFIGEMREKH